MTLIYHTNKILRNEVYRRSENDLYWISFNPVKNRDPYSKYLELVHNTPSVDETCLVTEPELNSPFDKLKFYVLNGDFREQLLPILEFGSLFDLYNHIKLLVDTNQAKYGSISDRIEHNLIRDQSK